MSSLPLGVYRHYKGNEYEVVALAHHSETEEVMVVYCARYGRGEVWVRPLQMFEESVATDAGLVPRFELVSVRPVGQEWPLVRSAVFGR